MKCSSHGVKREKKCKECKELVKRENATRGGSSKSSGGGGSSLLDWLEDIPFWFD